MYASRLRAKPTGVPCAVLPEYGGILMAKILVVDDEIKIREIIKEYAEFEGYEVAQAEDGMQAVEMVKNQDFDIIIMDVMMPKLDGYSACKEIRKIKQIPVIMLSARGEEYDKLFGFEIGVDDYVVKPFSPKELMARIRAVLNRASASQRTEDVIRYEGLEINFTAREVKIDGQKVSMTPKEYDLLFYLVKNMNIALSREKLLEEVWGFDFYGDDRTVDTHIKMLRNSLGKYRNLIVTLRDISLKRSSKLAEVKEKVSNKTAEIKAKRSLRSYVWMYFIFFTAFILILIWLFQYFFLERYYQSAKIRDITDAANQIIQAYGTDQQEVTNRSLAFDNSLCVVITDEMGNPLVMENNMGAYSHLNKVINKGYGIGLFKMISQLKQSDDNYITKIAQNENFKSKEIFYCTSIYTDDSDKQAYLFIESSIEPIDSTVSIIREQLIYITIILFELAFIVTMYISKRLSKPIVDITNTAKKFGEGDYAVEFNGHGYCEIEELSTVLNNAKDEIQKVSELRKDLIANISHDLRTPLTMVKAYAEMIRDLSGDNPVKRQEHIQVIIDEADRLSSLVNNLLELSKLESGNAELKLTDFSIVDKLNDCMTRYQILIEQNGYDIKYIPDEDRVITADIAKLDQVIYNFINNAINYTGDNKVIRIKQINKADVVRIEVTDNGKGISKELLPKIFDRYYRDAKVKRDVVGTGLGLSIVKHIVNFYHGTIRVTSQLDEGTEFVVTIPLNWKDL